MYNPCSECRWATGKWDTESQSFGVRGCCLSSEGGCELERARKDREVLQMLRWCLYGERTSQEDEAFGSREDRLQEVLDAWIAKNVDSKLIPYGRFARHPRGGWVVWERDK